jgi:hypothetical protein
MNGACRAQRVARRALVLLVLPVVAVPSACSDEPEVPSFCDAFAGFLENRAEIQALDPADLDAAEATEVAERYRAGVRLLKASSEGRYGQELENLETAVDDILRTLASIQPDADDSTWVPLVEDDLETAGKYATQVEDTIEPTCTPDTSD